MPNVGNPELIPHCASGSGAQDQCAAPSTIDEIQCLITNTCRMNPSICAIWKICFHGFCLKLESFFVCEEFNYLLKYKYVSIITHSENGPVSVYLVYLLFLY